MSDVYNIAKAAALGVPTEVAATLDLSNDVVRIALFDNEGGSPYSFNADHDYVSTVFDGGATGEEFTGTGYNRQGTTGISVSTDDTDDEGVFDADDVTFSSIDGATIAAALSYKQVGGDDQSPSDDPLLAHLTSTDFPLTANGGDVTLNFATEGIVNIT